MKQEIKEISDPKEKALIARQVLNDLPEWFGRPESVENYIKAAQDKPFLAYLIDNAAAGFIVLNATSADCAEIFVMGVKKNFQRQGVGRSLLSAYEKWPGNWVTLIRK